MLTLFAMQKGYRKKYLEVKMFKMVEVVSAGGYYYTKSPAIVIAVGETSINKSINSILPGTCKAALCQN